MKIALVSCCKTKLTEPAIAKDLYISDSFKKMRAYSEKTYDGWMILSALLGLVEPEEIIEPYEFTFIVNGHIEQMIWAKRVFSSIESIYPIDTEFYIFAGMDYRKYLITYLEARGHKVHVPLQGLGIGQQKAWLKKELSA